MFGFYGNMSFSETVNIALYKTMSSLIQAIYQMFGLPRRKLDVGKSIFVGQI